MTSNRKSVGSLVRRLRSFLLPRHVTLRMDLRSIDRVYHPAIDAARGEGRERKLSGYFAERDLVAEELEELRTQQLLRKAHRFDVLIPDMPYQSDREEDDNWVRGSATGRWLLKGAGRRLIQKQIRDERKSRFEERTRWLALLISLLVGLIGALTGLVSVLRK